MWYEEMDTDTSEPMEIDDDLIENWTDNLPFTDTWVLDLSENLYRQIPVLSDDPKYREISKEFKKSFSHHRPEIQQIKRIQNPAARALYNVQKCIVQCKLIERQKTDCQVERLLWHGTTSEKADTIARTRFDRGYAGSSAGTAYGHGSYFTNNAEFANGYVREPGRSVRRIILARVLTGECYQSRESSSKRKVPPFVEGSQVHRYDSIVDDLENPKQYVVFNDASACPEYVVIYKL